MRLAEDDDSDDLGGFGRGKRPFEDDEDEENGGWAINEDHSDRLWDSADEIDDEDEEEGHTADADDVEEDDEEEADLFGGGAPRGRRGRPKGSTNANRDKAAMSTVTARDTGSVFDATGGSLFDEPDATIKTETPNVGRSDIADRPRGDSASVAKTGSVSRHTKSGGAGRKSSATFGHPKTTATRKRAVTSVKPEPTAKKATRRKATPAKAKAKPGRSASKGTAKRSKGKHGGSKKTATRKTRGARKASSRGSRGASPSRKSTARRTGRAGARKSGGSRPGSKRGASRRSGRR